MYLKNIKKLNINNLFQLSILILIVIIITWLAYIRYEYVLKNTTQELTNQVISYQLEGLDNFSKASIALTQGDFLNKVIDDEILQTKLEEMLSLLRISTIENLFVIFKENDKYFFLLDTEKNLNERAELFQPFEPLSEAWDTSYLTGTAQKFQHQHSKNLWVSIVIPIIEDNNTVALLGADISYSLDKTMNAQLQYFGEFFFLISILSIAWFSLLYLLIIYFRHKYHDGYIDPLTNIYNRRYLYEVLENKLARNYQIIMIDIDYFKTVNDTYGHNTGDQVLKGVAQNIKDLIRPDDIFIRYGGEEFFIYTTGLDVSKSLEFAERLREKIANTPIYHKDIICNVTISLGINPYATNKKEFNDMLSLADEALYQAKKDGRNRTSLSKKIF